MIVLQRTMMLSHFSHLLYHLAELFEIPLPNQLQNSTFPTVCKMIEVNWQESKEIKNKYFMVSQGYMDGNIWITLKVHQ